MPPHMAGPLSVGRTTDFNSSSRTPRLLFCALASDGSQDVPQLRSADIRVARVHDAAELANAISAVSPDLIVLSPAMLRNVLNNRSGSADCFHDLEYSLSGLRSRNADVVRMVAKGLRNQEIADSLGLSLRSVKSILSALYLRYEVTNRTELLGLLIEQGHLAALRSPPNRAPKLNDSRRCEPVTISSRQEYA